MVACHLASPVTKGLFFTARLSELPEQMRPHPGQQANIQLGAVHNRPPGLRQAKVTAISVVNIGDTLT